MKIERFAKGAMALVVTLVSLAACNIETYKDGVSRFNAGSEPVSPPPPPPPPPPASFNPVFSEIQSNVFTPTCATSNCHDAGGAANAGNLNLLEANSYAELVGVPAAQDMSTMRVEAFDPNNSYLIRKLEDAAGISGAAMPPGGPLDPSIINIIRQWISNGAEDDRVAPVTPVKVTSISPAPGANLGTAPTQVVAGFDRDLDSLTITADTFVLEASGQDGTFTDGNETIINPVSVFVPLANQRSAVMDLNGVALADDTYRITLYGTGATVIRDIDGNALDGENLGGFPSGEGTAGGNYVSTFVLATPVIVGATLDEIQLAVFTPTCATNGCHDAVNPAESLDLSSSDTSFAELVGVPSIQQPALELVEPFSPDTSYLIHKLEGAATINGTVMPRGGMLDTATIDTIRTWIANGATRN